MVMSSLRPTTRRPALSAPRFSRLSSILTEANTRYTAVAASVRASTQLTHHARTRAKKLGLKLNVDAAIKCPQNQVSEKPLPVLERAVVVPQVQQQQPAPQECGRPTLRIAVPRAAARDVPTSTGPYSSISLSNSPAAAPTVLRGQGVPWRGPTSRFSLTPNDAASFSFAGIPYVAEHEVAALFSTPPRPAPKPHEEPVVPVVPDMLFEFSDGEEWSLQMDGPPATGGADYASSSSSSSSEKPLPSSASTSSSNSGSSSSRAASSGPVTPADGDVIHPFVGSAVTMNKRKGPFLDDLDVGVVEKCPKYRRKSDPTPVAQTIPGLNPKMLRISRPSCLSIDSNYAFLTRTYAVVDAHALIYCR
ncbi:hypothetical protein C8R45DRAFT_1221274 [Mycena sanguinolenta]|nr:hypothetical protein C8R45DRAFT_1221274 [Mycena sanguinolenta]